MNNGKEYSVESQIWALRQYGDVGPRTFRALMSKFGSPDAIHRASIEELAEINGLGKPRLQKIFDSSDHLDEAEEFIESLKLRDIKCSTHYDGDYPAIFNELNDAPPIFFYRGDLPKPGEKTVAIVGSHNATGEGIIYAVELAAKLAAQSISIVSGLARGIDTAGHVGALKAGGRTYAMIGSGLDNIFPEENRVLAAEIAKNGALISEYSPDTKSSTGKLIARNRLIVGLSQAVVIGEVFPDSSGTMDTATFCHQLGKIMFILLDGIERSEHDNSGVQKIIDLGAIPVTLEDGIDIIVKSLV